MNERKLQLDRSLLIEFIREWYRVQVISLHQLPSDSGKYIYRVKLASGGYWILRVGDDSSKAAITELARLLMFFEQKGYPAERLVLTTAQTAIVAINDWHLLMTTFLIGAPLECTPASLSLLGSVVGQLHALQPSLTYVPPQAEMLPPGEIAFARQQLTAIASLVPHQYVAQYELLEKALLSIDYGINLPTTLIHNDCHPGNALVTAPGQVTLFDWEGAGMGPAVLDVGFLLLNCDGKAPWDPLPAASFHPDAERIRAVIEGYCQYHQLTFDELEYLPTAVRFRSLVFGACSFATAIAKRENAEFSQWWWQRYCVTEEIVDMARSCFEQVLR